MTGRTARTSAADDGEATEAVSEEAPLIAGVGAAVDDGAVIAGSLRTDVGTSGWGVSSATRTSICWRLRPLALARTAW